MQNNNDLSNEPCGIPWLITFNLGISAPTHTVCSRSSKSSKKKVFAGPVIPKDYTLVNKMAWLTVSKALVKSKDTELMNLPLSIAIGQAAKLSWSNCQDGNRIGKVWTI